jgi:hypothetical protein
MMGVPGQGWFERRYQASLIASRVTASSNKRLFIRGCSIVFLADYAIAEAGHKNWIVA